MMNNNSTFAPRLEASPLHCAYCFAVLEANLKKDHNRPKINFEVADISAPLFVTWSKTYIAEESTNDYPNESFNLRGCIGTFSPLPIAEGLAKYSLISALKDSRFSEITLDEMPLLKVSVSFLVNFEENKNAYDWVVGKHGIIIDFKMKNHEYGATYLPEVAAEQEWTKKETIESLIRKAGYRGSINDDLIKSIALTTYESSKCSLTYKQWKQMTSSK